MLQYSMALKILSRSSGVLQINASTGSVPGVLQINASTGSVPGVLQINASAGSVPGVLQINTCGRCPLSASHKDVL